MSSSPTGDDNANDEDVMSVDDQQHAMYESDKPIFFKMQNLPKMNEYKQQLIYFLKFSGVFILFYYITSFCLGFIESFNFPFSLNNLKTINKPQKWKRLIYEFVCIVLGLLIFIIIFPFFWSLARGFSAIPVLNLKNFNTSNKKGMLAILIFLTWFVSGPNIMISLMNLLFSTKFNVKLPSGFVSKSDDKYFASAHQAVLYFSNFMALIIVKSSEKLMKKYRSRKGGDDSSTSRIDYSGEVHIAL